MVPRFRIPRGRPFALLAWSQFLWFAVVVFVWSGFLLTLSLDPDYTAGELLDHLQTWRETGVLYPVLGALPPLRVLNYPPLVLLMARAVAWCGASALLAGRLVNALGLIGLLAAVAWWVRARGARGAALAGTIGLLGASFPLLYGSGQFHIELWAAAGTVWGFALLAHSSSWRGAVLGGLALALACFAKQTQVVPAVLALAWTWWHHRRVAAAATAAFSMAGFTGMAGIGACFGAEAWRHLVTYTVGTYSAVNLGGQLLSHVAPWLILLAFTARIAWSETGQPMRDPAIWYWLGALVWSLSSARVGANSSYFLDLHLATVICAGPRIFGQSGSRSRLWGAFVALQIFGADIGAASALTVNLLRAKRTEAELPSLCARVRGEPLVLAEEAGMMRACGRPALIHPFIMASLARQGKWDPVPFERALRAGQYPLVLLPFNPLDPAMGIQAKRWTQPELLAFRSARVVEAVPTGRWIARW